MTRTATIHLSIDPEGVRETIPCAFCTYESKILTLLVGEPLPLFRPVSVEYADSMFLGESISCRPLDGSWGVRIQVEQVLNGLESLVALRARLLGEAVHTPAHAKTAIRYPAEEWALKS